MRVLHFVSYLVLAAALSACSGSGPSNLVANDGVASEGGVASEDDTADDVLEEEDVVEEDDTTTVSPIDFRPRIEAANESLAFISEVRDNDTRFLISEDQMRALGTASFEGDFIAANRSATSDEALIGDFTVILDLDGDLNATGSIDNILLVDQHESADNAILAIPTTATVTELGGSIDFDDLAIVNSPGASILVSNLTGTLTMDDTDIDVVAISNLVPTVNDNLLGSVGLTLENADDNSVSLWTGVINATATED